jgi:hypothetical protein
MNRVMKLFCGIVLTLAAQPSFAEVQISATCLQSAFRAAMAIEGISHRMARNAFTVSQEGVRFVRHEGIDMHKVEVAVRTPAVDGYSLFEVMVSSGTCIIQNVRLVTQD